MKCIINRQLIFVFLILPFTGGAQVMINGMVADSATLHPLANVNIYIQNKAFGTVSDTRGHFKIQAALHDTLIFSMVGYNLKKYSVRKVQEAVLIYLAQEIQLLRPVIIDADILIPGLDKMKVKDDRWRNTTMDFANFPGFQGVQTFGPGAVIRGGISKLFNFDKEKKKLKKVQVENVKAKSYIETVNSDEVKGRIMRDHAIDETEYYRLLAIFNEKNRDIIYELQGEELISLLIIFYSQNVNKK